MSTSDLTKHGDGRGGGEEDRESDRGVEGGKKSAHLGMLMSLFRGRRATLLKAILTPTATTSVKEITPPIT